MENLLILKRNLKKKIGLLAFLPIISVVVPLTTVFSTYALTLLFNWDKHTAYVLYVSSTGMYWPESSVFAMGLSMTGVLFVVTCHIMYNIMVRRSHSKTEVMILYMYRIYSYIAGFCIGATASVSYEQEPTIHTILAIGFFVFTLGVHACVVYMTQGYAIIGVRVAIFVFAFIFTVLYNFVPIVASLLRSANLGREQFEQMKDILDSIGGVFEWIAVILLIGFFATYAIEFSEFEIEYLSRSREKEDLDFIDDEMNC